MRQPAGNQPTGFAMEGTPEGFEGWKKLLHHARRLTELTPDDHGALAMEMGATDVVSRGYHSRGEAEQADKLHTAALEMASRLDFHQITQPAWRTNALNSLDDLAFQVFERGQAGLAIELFSKIIDESNWILEREYDQIVALNLCETLDRRALAYDRTGHREQAMADFSEEVQRLEEELGRTPNMVLAAEKAGKACYSVGKRHAENGDLAKAEAWLQRSLKHFAHTLDIDDSRWPALMMQRMCLDLCIEMFWRQERYNDAIAAIQSKIAVSKKLPDPPAAHTSDAILILLGRAKLGKCGNILRDVKNLRGQADVVGQFRLAQALAVALAADDAIEETTANAEGSLANLGEVQSLSLEILRDLQSKEKLNREYFVDSLLKDADWDALRNVDVFQAVIGSLDAGIQPNTEAVPHVRPHHP